MVHLFEIFKQLLSNSCRDAANLNMKGIRFFLLTLYTWELSNSNDKLEANLNMKGVSFFLLTLYSCFHCLIFYLLTGRQKNDI